MAADDGTPCGAVGLRHRVGVVELRDLSYQLVYMYDYDLVLPIRGLASRRAVKRGSRVPGRWVSASEVAEMARGRLERPA